jgi:hypothetical protein
MSGERQRLKLAPVSTRLGRTVLRPSFVGPALRDNGPLNFVYPHCSELLAEGIHPGQVFDIIVDCGWCRRASQFPRLPRVPPTPRQGYLFLGAGVTEPAQTRTLHNMQLVGGAVVTSQWANQQPAIRTPPSEN